MRIDTQRRWLAAASAVVFPMAAIGVAHAPFARSFLMRWGGCPVAVARMTSVEAESARHLALASLASERGMAPAPVRPALGFSLDRTTSLDVGEWAKRTRTNCEKPRDGLIECAGVAPQSLGLKNTNATIDELAFEFDTQSRLVNVTTFRTHLTPQAAETAARAIVGSLNGELGAAERRAGEFDSAQMSAPGAASISTAVYRYSDYVADVTAMNAPSGGPSIREHYMSARD